MTYTITREDAERDLRALRGALSGFPAGVSSSIVPALQELADSIEAQMPKPAIEEPLAFGSVVRSKDGTLYVRTSAVAQTPWRSGPWAASWDELDVVEVLRVGIGEAESSDDAYARGLGNAIYSIRHLRKTAITAERADAYDKAIAAIEGIS